MQSVFDQLSWKTDTDATSILKLVSAQLDTQEELRRRVRILLTKSYPDSSLAWISTVTWSSPKLVPLQSYDLSNVSECEESDLRTPLVSLRIPGARFLRTLGSEADIGYRARLRCPVLTWIGRAHSVHGPWENMREYSPFVGVEDQLISLSEPISDSDYQELLAKRRIAREQYSTGDGRRVAAERAVRQARKTRNLVAPIKAEASRTSTVESQIELSQHSELLSERKKAQENYPPGHPERIKAERAVRKSRSAKRCVSPCFD